jgi:hypothetical protein
MTKTPPAAIEETTIQSVKAEDFEFKMIDMGPGYKPEVSAAACLTCLCGSGCMCGCMSAL